MHKPAYADATLILPTLNEGQNIGKMLSLLAKYEGLVIMVVDDGSKDSTGRIVGEMARTRPNLRFVDRSAEPGKGIAASTLAGARLAKTKYVLVMDADLQHPVEKVPELLRALESGDMAVCVRKEIRNWPLQRRIISIGAVLLSRVSLFLRGSATCAEPTSGFFGFRGSLLSRIDGRRIKGAGCKLVFDMLKQMGQDTRVAEVGYVFVGREAGASKFNSRQITLFLRSLLS